jgi:hypothetical protein
MVQNDLDCFRSEVIEHLEASEHRQSNGVSCSASHSCSHPHYDDDLDDQSLDSNVWSCYLLFSLDNEIAYGDFVTLL